MALERLGADRRNHGEAFQKKLSEQADHQWGKQFGLVLMSGFGCCGEK
jgi:hypothetical protein